MSWFEGSLRGFRDVTYNYNHTKSTAHHRVPAMVNHPQYDPELRKALYGKDAKLHPFADFYHEALHQGERANTPRAQNEEKNIKEHADSYRKNDLVYIDVVEPRVGGRYHVQHKQTYRVYSVNTVQKPYLYRLQKVANNDVVPGYFHGSELMAADLVKNLQIDSKN